MAKKALLKELGLEGDELFRVLTHAVPGLVWLLDAQGNLCFVNRAWKEYTGLADDQSAGRGWLDAVHPEDAAAIREVLDSSQTDRQDDYEVELRFRRHDGTYRWHLVRARPVDEASQYWIGCSVDIQVLSAARKREAMQARILEMVAAGKDVKEILAALCGFAERELPEAYCSILLVDAENERFTQGVALSLPDALIRDVEGVSIGSGVGSCGTAAYERRDVVTTDIATDPLWADWRDAALPIGLRACWSRPVYASNGTVLATFAFYFKTVRAPNDDELERMDAIRHIASLAIERARMVHSLQESEEHYRHMVELNPQIPWTADANGLVVSVSSRWEAETGISPEDTLGEGWLGALHPDDVEQVVQAWREKQKTGEPVDFEYRIRLADGYYRWVRARGAPRRDDSGNIVLWYGTLEDIHDHKIATDKLRRAAYEDDLTGLPNRRSFEEELRRALPAERAEEAVGLLIFDLVDFKQVNDRFGHRAGDRILRLVGNNLRRLATSDEFVTRLGADEFGVIVRGVASPTELLERAHGLLSGVVLKLKRSARGYLCHATVGCALAQPGEGPDELFKSADLALASAKTSGQDPVRLFTPAIRHESQRKTGEIELAREALKKGWIVPHYQPKVSLTEGRVVGVEALMRIDHPQDGLLSPASFMSALDDLRTSGALGERMLAMALDDLSGWTRGHCPVDHLALNVSTASLTRPGFVEKVLRRLQRLRLPSDMLQLEITERVLIDDLAADVQNALRNIRDKGVRISLDDFGTGYASLTHLRRFPVDEIKIDHSFMVGLTGDSAEATIVRTMINLGHNLGMSVVAEGVQSSGQALLLRSWGCEVAQGFYFAQPVAAADVPALVHSINAARGLSDAIHGTAVLDHAGASRIIGQRRGGRG